MGKQIMSTGTVGHIKNFITDVMLTDVATVREYTISVGYGGTVDPVAGDLRTYNGSPAIPCRLDASRHYREVRPYGQEALANEYTLHFPHDFTIKQGDRVDIGGHNYEVIKMLDNMSLGPTIELLVVEILIGED
jgi:hypothetical protein